MLKKYYVSALLCATVFGQVAYADDWGSGELNFVTSIGYQDKLLTFDQTYKGPAPNDNSYADFSVYIPMGNLSFTTSVSRFFLTLKYEKSLADASTDVDETNRNIFFPVSDANLLTIDGSQLSVEREDKNITLGVNLWRGWNVFVGYMKGQTQLTPDPYLNFNTFYYNKAYIVHDEIMNGRNIHEYKQTYTEKGPYIGTSYAWKIADAGVLSASIAYANMDGKYLDNANCVINSCTAFDWEGTTTGTSVGLTWTAPLGESSSYFLDLRQQAYTMDGKDTTGNYGTQTVTTDETMRGLSAGVQFYF